MKKSQISFKFKNEKNFDSIRFPGLSISLKELKNKINEKLQDKNPGASKEKKKEKSKDDILIFDEMTKQLISDDSAMIAADKKVVIERVSFSQPQPTTTYRDRGFSNVKTDKSEFICKLCKSQFINPTLTRCCGDTACETCLDKQKNECPFCKKKVVNSIKAGPNVKLQEMIQKHSASSFPQPPTSMTYSQYGSYQAPNYSSNFSQLPFSKIEGYLNGAKYFIIKSSNFENIDLSIKHSEWATTKSNETKLNNAFQRSSNVILIFSVNKSSQFQGYARMESPSTNRVASWQGQESIKLGGPFKIQWLRVCNVNFSRVSQLKNKFNNNEPIKKSRDTQEIPDDIGSQICRMFETPDKDQSYYPMPDDRRRFMFPFGTGAPTPFSGGGGGSGPMFPVASSPREMRIAELASNDSASPSETKTLTPKRADEIQSSEREELMQKSRFPIKKKEEEKLDLLGDLDLDEPVVFFNGEEEEPPQIEEQSEVKNGHTTENLADQISFEDPEEQKEDFLHDMEEENDLDRMSEIEEEAPENHQILENNILNDDNFTNKSETKESAVEYKSESERIQEEIKESNIEEEEENQFFNVEHEDNRSEKKEVSKSPSREAIPEEKKKQPPKIPMEPQKHPAPPMVYDPHMMMRQNEPMMRPNYTVDHRPPPPSAYPSHSGPMRYPSYPNSYPPPSPYSSYPMPPYQSMEMPHMRQGMAPGYPYPYYGFPPTGGMWPGGNRQFPYDNKGKQEGQEADDDNLSQASDDSSSSKKKERKKKSKKEKKKKRSRDRSRDKSEIRDRDRSRDKNRVKSKSKSRRK